jgi:hypothetical protein
VLTPQEKAYCRGLAALQRKDFIAADREFGAGEEQTPGHSQFTILREATRLLAYVLAEKKRLAEIENSIQETIHHG